MKVTKLKLRVVRLGGGVIVVLSLGQAVFSQQATTASPTPATPVVAVNQQKIRVVFDGAKPGVVYVESDG